MFEYTFYDPEDGRITETLKTSVEMTEETALGRSYITGIHNAWDRYVVGGAAVPKPQMPCQLSGKTLSGIPAGSTLWMGQTSYEVNDGVAELSCDQPAKLQVTVIRFPYMPFVVEVDFAN